MRHLHRYLVALAALGFAALAVTFVYGQTISYTVPTTNANILQWGSTAVTQATVAADNVGNPTVPLHGSIGMLWDSTQWLRAKSAALATYPVATTLTSRNSVGAQLSEKGSRWTVIHNPAASSQATASIANEATVRHVADCVSFSAGSTTAPALTALTVNLRDGATGAGTIIWTAEVLAANATGENVPPFSICGLNLAGTTNTAMTLEFSALLTNLVESVSLSGFNLQ